MMQSAGKEILLFLSLVCTAIMIRAVLAKDRAGTTWHALVFMAAFIGFLVFGAGSLQG